MRRRLWASALALIAATGLGLSACSSADVGAASGDAAQPAEPDAISSEVPQVDRNPDFPLPEIKGDWGAIPSMTPIEDKPPTEITSKLLVPGDGLEVPAGGVVTAYYTGFLWDGKTFDSSFNHGDGPLTFDLNRVVDGWKYGVPGARVGDRILLIVPAKYGYGSVARDNIPADSTLVFVLDVVDVPGADLSDLKEATATDEALPAGLLVEGTLGEQPVIGFEEGSTPPEEEMELLLAQGAGNVITPSDTVMYHYTGVYWGTPNSGDSTWKSGPTVLPAQDTVFLGHNVGDRILFVFPAQPGGDPAQVMIVDVVAAY